VRERTAIGRDKRLVVEAVPLRTPSRFRELAVLERRPTYPIGRVQVEHGD